MGPDKPNVYLMFGDPCHVFFLSIYWFLPGNASTGYGNWDEVLSCSAKWELTLELTNILLVM